MQEYPHQGKCSLSFDFPQLDSDDERGRDYVVSLPHTVDEATYQESYTAFAAYAKQAMAAGWSINYGAQPISAYAVRKSFNTPLNLSVVDQDCKY